jgi:hypothetical protein
MAEATYYFTAHTTAWDNDPDNMDDGDLETYAHDGGDTDIQLLTANTCDGTDLGTITKVESRVYAYQAGQLNNSVVFTPKFGGTDNGDEANYGSFFTPAWSDYEDITEDTNAPGTWDWDDVKDLDYTIEAETNSGGSYVAKVEIRVTYTPGDPPSESQQPEQQIVIIS